MANNNQKGESCEKCVIPSNGGFQTYHKKNCDCSCHQKEEINESNWEEHYPIPEKEEVREEWERKYENRFCKKRKLSDGTSTEYIHLKGSALDTDLRDFISSILAQNIKDLQIKAKADGFCPVCHADVR